MHSFPPLLLLRRRRRVGRHGGDCVARPDVVSASAFAFDRVTSRARPSASPFVDYRSAVERAEHRGPLINAPGGGDRKFPHSATPPHGGSLAVQFRRSAQRAGPPSPAHLLAVTVKLQGHEPPCAVTTTPAPALAAATPPTPVAPAARGQESAPRVFDLILDPVGGRDSSHLSWRASERRRKANAKASSPTVEG